MNPIAQKVVGSLALALLGATLLGACRSWNGKTELERDNPIRPPAIVPFGLEEFFAEEPHTPDPKRARLGRWLFYDTRLSSDGRVSCATCHRPENAFSEPVAVSLGVYGRRGRRKAMTVANLGARTLLVDTPAAERSHAFFWDGRAVGLETQVLQPISNPAEMGLDGRALVTRLTGVRPYATYFAESFGSEAITLSRVAAALADYVRTLRSGNSAYDRWRYAGDASGMSTSAQRGSDVFFFKGRCAMCHAGFNFSDGRYFNLASDGTLLPGSSGTEAARLSRVTSRTADDSRHRPCGMSPGMRRTCTTARYRHCEPWWSSTIAAATTIRGVPVVSAL